MLKKVFALIISTAMCLSLFSGCGESAVGEAQAEETTAAATTVPEGLTAEETAVWESMPEIVTMRVLNDLQEKTTEILYIEKSGNVKKFMCDEYYKGNMDTEWVDEKITKSPNTETVGTVNISQLIEFYKIIMLIDDNSYMRSKFLLAPEMVSEKNYSYELYGIQNKDENSSQSLLIALGDSINPKICDDPHGNEALDSYVQLDPYMILIDGYIGFVTE